MRSFLENASLQYHEARSGGRLAFVLTKPMETQRVLSLADSPGGLAWDW
jgi:malic enzyme